MTVTRLLDVAEVPAPSSSDDSRELIAASLSAIRTHLGMEVGFVGRFDEGRRIFEFVDADAAFRPITVGDSDPLEESYCARVADGRLPELIHDARQVPEAARLTATRDLPVGAHISVPLRTADGAAFGTLCCFSREADASLSERDLGVLRMVGELVSVHLLDLLDRDATRQVARERVHAVLAAGGPAIALQPIYDLRSDTVTGVEALSRFPTGSGWSPDRWFAEAHAVGLGPTLEAAAVRNALGVLPSLAPELSMAVNVSPGALCRDGALASLLAAAPAGRVVVELTEHERLDLSGTLLAVLADLRDQGVRIAVDDAGSGYAGLEHILDLGPDVLKLDRSLVDGIAQHPGRQAMCEAMVRFAARTDTLLVAEGVESEHDLQTLRHLNVRYAQGYHLGRPELWVGSDRASVR